MSMKKVIPMIDKTKLKLVESEIKEHISIPMMYNDILGFYGDIAHESVCCPFHGEKTPSFSYSENLGIWTCFGECSKSGDTIELYRFYLLKHKGIQLSRTKTVEILMTIEEIKHYLSVDSIELKRSNTDFSSYLDSMSRLRSRKLDKNLRKKVNAVDKVMNSRSIDDFLENYNKLLWSKTNIHDESEVHE